MNAYYLINTEQLDQVRQYTPENGLPNQLFQYSLSSDGSKAIVQADWADTTWLDANGTFLGELQPDGSAGQGVYEELAKPEWQYTSE